MRWIVVLMLFRLAASAEPPIRAGALERRLARLSTSQRIALYEAALRKEPGNPESRAALAATFLQRMRETGDPGMGERARRLVDQVLSSDKDHYRALRVRNELRLFAHEFAQAAEGARALLLRQPDDPANWATLGDALMEMGRYDEAADAFQRAVDLRPDLVSYNRAAWYRFVTGDRAGAIELMRLAVRSGSPSHENTAWCSVELGHLYAHGGQWNEAAQAYQAALAILPGYHPALAGLARADAARGRTEQAMAGYRKAQSVVPLPEYAAALHGLARDPQEAERQWQMVEVADKLGQARNERADRTLALIYADHQRNLDRALELAKAELEIRRDVFSFDALAWVLHQRGQYEEAAQAIAEALRWKTPQASFHYHAGRIALARGDRAAGRTHLETALRLNPEFDLRQAADARALLAAFGSTTR